jgi:hypothetical protein
MKCSLLIISENKKYVQLVEVICKKWKKSETINLKLHAVNDG